LHEITQLLSYFAASYTFAILLCVKLHNCYLTSLQVTLCYFTLREITQLLSYFAASYTFAVCLEASYTFAVLRDGLHKVSRLSVDIRFASHNLTQVTI
jgi:hypothetical protein